jgi:hypothetical protein
MSLLPHKVYDTVVLGVGQENNRGLVRMLINSFIWMAVGSIYMAIVV